MKNPELKLINEKGKRLDGRGPNDVRKVTIKAGVLERADGSCYLEWGNNKVMAAVFGPKEVLPRHLQNPLKAIIKYRYNMAPFSVDDRARPGPNRRSTEISKISKEALEKVVILEKFPKTQIEVYVEVLEAEAGTRCAALTAAAVALADAGIPMKDIVSSCAAGKINGTMVVDLNKDEDNYGEADFPIAIMPRTKEVLLMQMDGDFSKEELEQALDMAIEGCMQVSEVQKKALKERYNIGDDNGN